MHYYTYILVREDLNKGQQITQAGHAAYEAGKNLDPDKMATHMVVLSIKNQEELLIASQMLESHGVEHCLFFEPDHNIGESALATRPIQCILERKLFKKWKCIN